MYNLNKLFLESKTISVNYHGEIIHLYDHLPMNKGEKFNIKILSTRSEYKQGISFHVIKPSHKKLLQINEDSFEGFTLWQDTLPENGAEILIKDDCILSIWNAWEEIGENGDKRIWSALQNAAMKISEKGNERIYYCNDGEDDEDFNDLIFCLTKVT